VEGGAASSLVVERDQLSSEIGGIGGRMIKVVKHRATKASVTKRVEERSNNIAEAWFFRNSSSTKGRRRRIASGVVASWNRRRLYAK